MQWLPAINQTLWTIVNQALAANFMLAHIFGV